VIIAIDTFYESDTKAFTVGVLFNSWQDKVPSSIISVISENNFGPYIPGQFYKRELPCILDLLKKVDLSKIDFIILDGFLRLKNADGSIHDGLGLHLRKKLNIPHIKLIGVAKSLYCKCDDISIKVYRNKEVVNPLFVQGEGISDQLAADLIRSMDGNYRLPTLLKILDKETKKKRGI
jgi:deoxyinosine 3'endonuclease (endonuclease V)